MFEPEAGSSGGNWGGRRVGRMLSGDLFHR